MGDMDELLKDFLTETSEHLDAVGTQLIAFERDSADAQIIGNIFRLVHTIKGTCGFLGLNRLQSVAHAAETLIGDLRNGGMATGERVTLILEAIDRIRYILAELDKTAAEPEGDDAQLIAALEAASNNGGTKPHLLGSDDDLLDLAGASEEPGVPRTPVVMAPELPTEKPAKPEPPRAMTLPADPQPADVQDPKAADAAAHDALKHAAEAASPVRTPSTIRVAVGSLERIMTLVSELVLTRNQLMALTRNTEDDLLKPPLQRLSTLTSDLQDSIMRARMQPMSRLFANLPRLVRDLSAQMGKKIELISEGAETELDRQLIELVRDPLTHLIRNCADHGIEMPHERRLAGKRDVGTIKIAANHEAGHINIEISDDGRGLDVARIRQKALSNGLATEDELARMSDDLVCRFIFEPGFSTAAAVTNVSGRGVGMDVVRENLESIGGNISMTTVAGAGTVFSMKIPLTLAIAPALIIEAAGQRFAIPQHSVIEALPLGGLSGNQIDVGRHGLALRLRDSAIALIDLREALKIGAPVTASGDHLVVVMRVGQYTFGIIVDAVADVQEIVVKPLAQTIADIPVYSGNTILGDGSIVLILDPAGLANMLGFETSGHYRVSASDQSMAPPIESTRLLVFRDRGCMLQALPLSVIARIEKAQPGQIIQSDGQMVMFYNDKLMPVITTNERVLSTELSYCVLVVGVGGEPMGIAVSDVVDVVDARLDIQISSDRPGVAGVTNILGEPAEILDAAHFMRIARPNAFNRGHARRFRILLIDDKLFFRDMLSPIILAAGYEVCTASSAQEGLSLIKKGIHFDAILTDIDMSEINGYEFARRMQDETRRNVIPG